MKVRAEAVYSIRRGRSFVRSYFLFLSVFLCIVLGFDADPVIAKNPDRTRNVKYGISGDAFQFHKDTIARNQNLAKILRSYQVPYSVIHEAAQKSKPVFDVRRFRAGNPYYIVRQPDSGRTVRYFVYEQDPINYVVYDLGSPVNVYAGKKAVETKVHQASGMVRSSLSQTFSRMGMERELVHRLSDLYAWTLDFHHLVEGDHFRFLYEKKYVDGVSVGLGRVIAARFHHKGKDFYGFYYQKDGNGMYYDENGNSMEKVFLKAPVRYTRITSRPTKRRLHPILKKYRPHFGTDYAAPSGTPIHSIGEGIVMKKGYHRSLGRYVVIKHHGVYKSQYLHMSRIEKGIKPGRNVNRGQVIGYVGKTGMATGPHLCFRFWKNGRVFDHHNANVSTGEFLAKKYLPDYREYVQELQHRLDGIPLTDTVHLAEINKPPGKASVSN